MRIPRQFAPGLLALGALGATATPACVTPSVPQFEEGQRVRYVLEVFVDGEHLTSPAIETFHGNESNLSLGEGPGSFHATVRPDGMIEVRVPVEESHGFVAAPRVLLMPGETADLHFHGRNARHHVRVRCSATPL